MNIELLDLTVRDLVAGYHDDGRRESKRMTLRTPQAYDMLLAGER